ncbi:hypothetical protein BGZ50_007556 [Haplosporangium sp. Z 11]|nr:hypothetical protein BGZ50_007556 [Haplosporangium sp. Z 11]
MLPISSANNPLNLPEIRMEVSQYVSAHDAVSCALVSREWAKDFIHRVWHTIDFDVCKRQSRLDPTTIGKYGHLIQVVRNLTKQSQIKVLACASVSGLSELEIIMDGTPAFDAFSRGLISRNYTGLTKLELSVAAQSLRICAPVESIIRPWYASMPSKLTVLKLQRFLLAREAFSMLLRGSPSLLSLDLWGTQLDTGPAFDQYQHFGVKHLTAVAKLVTGELSRSPAIAPLFVHFPNLELWSTVIERDVPTQYIRDGVRRWWPNFRKIDMRDTPELIMRGTLVNVFQSLTSIRFQYFEISTMLILAAVTHQETLKDIHAYSYCGHRGTDCLFRGDDRFRGLGSSIQYILHQCSKLESFRFPVHEMDMNLVESEDWSCSGLKTLNTRIRQLDTAEKVDVAINLWTEVRMNRVFLYQHDMTVEARVVRHLLKFKHLTSVCLGTREYRVKDIL